MQLYVHSTEKDPDFFYGDSIELDLKELRLNIQSYSGKRVAFEGVVAYYVNQGVYVESFDEEMVVLHTTKGTLVIRGSGLHLQLLSLDGGQVHVDGMVDSMTYENEVREAGSFFARLFG